MTTTMSGPLVGEFRLEGLGPTPLASYLAALGLLRVIGTQADPAAAGRWERDRFHLRTRLGESAIVSFLLSSYQPTPVLSPWNGGSGFGEKDKSSKEVLDQLAGSTDPRLEPYRRAIVAVRSVPPDENKGRFVQHLRNVLPDDAIEWLDAAVVLSGDDPAFPILLGTGGNDGRLDFSANYMQHVTTVLGLKPSKAKQSADRAEGWLRAVLFDEPGPPNVDVSTGQFSPGGSGGPNSAPTGAGKTLTNPWAFVLMIEGTMLFTAAAVRRRGDPRQLAAAPFTFRPAPVGYASATDEKGRGEVWAPLWQAPMSVAAVRALFAESRMSWDGRPATRSEDAVRSLARLQGDRRIGSFVRYVIAERHGQAHAAVPVGRLMTPSSLRPEVDLTASTDRWLDGVRRLGDAITPSLASRLRACEQAVFDLAQREHATHETAERLVGVLGCVADVERVISRSPRYRDSVNPVSRLRAGDWLPFLQPLFDTKEGRIARALASGHDPHAAQPRSASIRALLSGVGASRSGVEWLEQAAVPAAGPVVVRLAEAAIARDRDVFRSVDDDGVATRSIGLATHRGIPLGDLVDFALGRVDTDRLGLLLQALMMLDWRHDPGTNADGPGSGPTSSERAEASTFRPLPAIPAAVAAVLAHGGDPSLLPVPQGLPRMLVAAPRAAAAALSRSLRVAGYRSHVGPIDASTRHGLAATLLLSPPTSLRNHYRATLLDAAGLISPAAARRYELD